MLDFIFFVISICTELFCLEGGECEHLAAY